MLLMECCNTQSICDVGLDCTGTPGDEQVPGITDTDRCDKDVGFPEFSGLRIQQEFRLMPLNRNGVLFHRNEYAVVIGNRGPFKRNLQSSRSEAKTSVSFDKRHYAKI